jgi:hypothetical protein
MSDETVDSSATATETTAEAVTETTAAPAEAENTETTPAKEATTEEPKGPIPYDRFAQVNDQKKEAIERAARLEAELEQARATKPAETVVPTAELTEPPEHLSQREKVDFYVRQSARNMIREELGMDLQQAKGLLEAIPSVSDATYEQQWERMCTAKGLDPKDRVVQDLTRGLVKGSGHEVEDALNVVADLVGKKTAVTTATPPQRMENDATTGTMTDKSVELVFDKASARKLAEQGKRAPLLSAVDILKAADSKRKAAG